MTRYQQLAELFRRVLALELSAYDAHDRSIEVLVADWENREAVKAMFQELLLMVVDELKPREVYRRDQG